MNQHVSATALSKPLSSTWNLTVAVLVNSLNAVGYCTDPAAAGEFQRYPKLYLDHVQVPYDVIDTATTAPPDLSRCPLIIAGHSGLALSPAWQNAIMTAVGAGVGFVNLDADPAVGSQAHMQSLFGAGGAVNGTPASSISIPANVLPGGTDAHFIAGWQRKFRGDPAGDIIYPFHPGSNNVLQTVTATVLSGATGTVVARLGTAPLILARATGAGRAVHLGTYRYLKADRFGFVQGVDDLFWRSLVWAARKPFVLRGYPRFWSVQMDDTMPGWGVRVRDMYDASLTGLPSASGTGGAWKVTGYVFTSNLPPGSSERASVIADIQAGRLQVSPHSFNNVKYGDMFWNGTGGPLTDGQWLTNLSAITTWKQGHGGPDVIPSFSRSFVAHYWDVSDNIGHDLWAELGFRYVTTKHKPGVRYADTINDVTAYTGDGSERLRVRSFWAYELPPIKRASENFPFFFADDLVIGSRAGLPPRTFFLFASQYIDYAHYPRNDYIWPSATYNHSVAASVDQLLRYTWRHWSALSPVELFTHDIINYQLSTSGDRKAVISHASQWLRDNGARHVFMQELGDYMYARSKSILTRAELSDRNLTLTFSGAAATGDGALIDTQALVFYEDTEGVPVTVSGFAAPTAVTVALPARPPIVSAVSPTSGPSVGGTSVTITGQDLAPITSVLFGGIAAAGVAAPNSATVVATSPGGSGTVDVTVIASQNSATLTSGFRYVSPPPTAGHFDFTYANRTALLADGWSFTAKTAGGGSRNTEQIDALAISYDQASHPGIIRIPVRSGELWQNSNSGQNMLFRDLPVTWKSLRIRVAAFNPFANYQQVGLLAYQDDDNYVNIQRNFNDAAGGAVVGFFSEVASVATRTDRRPLANTGNLMLRLDRDPATNAFTALYSVDSGTSWVQLTGSPSVALTNPRLAIQVGANTVAATPTADLAWAETIQ